ncbi:hypothetical protein [Acidovorax sp. 59]|uniref:DUF7281 domain-containing protein n=2 Tax=unclassified Acidovorax TaxID=2684926 RepID=UPI0011783CC6|nr:hypothetical protein [Acidovorax sp. 59]
MNTNFSLGLSTGRNIEYGEQDWLRAEQLLRSHDIPTSKMEEGAGRIELAAYGGVSEKSFSQAPHANSVAIRCMGHCELDGLELYTPEGCYLALTMEAAARIQCDRLIVVENLESFRRLERYAWLSPEGSNVLVVYRGDTIFNGRDAQALVLGRSEPIWAFFDFDPQGLMLANALPHDRLEKILVPDLDVLAGLCDTVRGRELFHDQVGGSQTQLDASQHPAVVPLWVLMKRLRSGATQERMASTGTEENN